MEISQRLKDIIQKRLDTPGPGKENPEGPIKQAANVYWDYAKERIRSVTNPFGEAGNWERHTTVDARYKETLNWDASKYTFAGGYDAARRYPNNPEGLKILAGGYQIGTALKRMLNPFDPASTKEIFKKELSDLEGNIAGINKAQEDIKAGRSYSTLTDSTEPLDPRTLFLSKIYSKTKSTQND